MAPVSGSSSAQSDDAIAAQLRGFKQKIAAMRAATHGQPLLDDGALLLEGGAQTPRTRRRRALPPQRSSAEDYRRARSVQVVVQVACALQLLAALTLAASLARLRLLVALVPCSLAGAFATLPRVQQRGERTTGWMNVGFGLGCTAALVHLLPALPTLAPALAAAALAAAAAYSAGVAAAVYCVLRPLRLYRYETVALDEASADQRSLRKPPGRWVSDDLELQSVQSSYDGMGWSHAGESFWCFSFVILWLMGLGGVTRASLL